MIQEEQTTMREKRTDWLIYATMVLTAAAAVMSSPEPLSMVLQQAESLMLTASVSDAAVAAGALGDVRYLDVPP
jgi:hypothetical protein